MLKKIIVILTIIVLVFFAVCYGVWRLVANGKLQKYVVEQASEAYTLDNNREALFTKLLGFDAPRIYLVLLLNNTELRPGGGFIGSYAVLKVDKGLPSILKIEGTEIIDNYAPDAYLSPPTPLAKYLGTKKWQFRDSNWSPDFSISASTSLALYKLERGLQADNIDGVIGITPTIIEKLLEQTGPLHVSGKTFTAENFTHDLEYDVEYGFANRGIEFKDRKQLITAVAQALLRRLLTDGWKHWQDYLDLLPKLAENKQFMMFMTRADEQEKIEDLGIGGLMKAFKGDYLLWSDANLGALKTDATLQRFLTYRVTSTVHGLTARAEMRYHNRGGFDWRTTRYRNYARIFVPKGSKLLKVEGSMEKDKSKKPGEVMTGEENGFTWFGAFISIEPKNEGNLVFEYLLPSNVSEMMAKTGAYTLLTQKQLGLVSASLTLDMMFDKKIVSAMPGEDISEHGDNRYRLKTEFANDMLFTVNLAP